MKAVFLEIQGTLPYFFPSLFFVIGACIGSFLNVCIYRIPKKESVIKPRSHCECDAKIAWYDNIPILSWFLLRGRCRVCRKWISFRYPFIEFLCAVLFLIAWILNSPGKAIAEMIFIGIIIPTIFIDFDHLYIPDRFSIGGFMVGVIISLLIPSLHGFSGDAPYVIEGFRSSIIALTGAFIGSGLILWIGLVSERLLHKETMGFGDIKLMGCIGAFCGWQGALFAIFGGAFLGTFILLPYLVYKKLKDKKPVDHVVPFGPWLAMSALAYLLFFKNYVDAYFMLFQEALFRF